MCTQKHKLSYYYETIFTIYEKIYVHRRIRTPLQAQIQAETLLSVSDFNVGEEATMQPDLWVSSCTETALLELQPSDGKFWWQVPLELTQ